MKSIYSISSTQVGEKWVGEDDVRSTCISCYNRAFPLDLEENYVKLTNLIYDYVETCQKLGNIDYDVYLTSTYLQKAYSEMGKDYTTLRSTLQQAIDKLDENKTPDDFKNVEKIAKWASDILRKNNAIDWEIKSINDSRFSHEQDIAKERDDLARIIANISMVLQNIDAQTNGSEKRIDSLLMGTRQLSDIDGLDIPELKKDTLKRQLISYFNMRCIGFEYIEEFARKVVNDYMKRNILDEDIASIFHASKCDPEFEIYRIILVVLQALPSKYHLGSLTSQPCETIDKDSIAIEFMTDYLATGIVDFKKLDVLDGCSVDIAYAVRALTYEIERVSKKHR